MVAVDGRICLAPSRLGHTCSRSDDVDQSAAERQAPPLLEFGVESNEPVLSEEGEIGTHVPGESASEVDSHSILGRLGNLLRDCWPEIDAQFGQEDVAGPDGCVGFDREFKNRLALTLGPAEHEQPRQRDGPEVHIVSAGANEGKVDSDSEPGRTREPVPESSTEGGRRVEAYGSLSGSIGEERREFL